MNILAADYYDGRTSVRHAVSAIVAPGKLKVVGRDVNAEFDLRRVRRSLRVANTPRWLYLPGGGALVTADNDAVDRMTRKRRYDRVLHRWESRPALAALATVAVIASLWLGFDRGVPVAVERIAERIPPSAEAALGEQTLRSLDQRVTQPSTLSPERQAALRERFAAMTKSAGDATPYRLEFRSSKLIGANAFALPSGIIVMTDELVKLSRRDEEVLAVLAHELGHVRHRHTMRRLLEASATGLIIAAVTGDVASATSLAAAAPAVLLQTRYSRDNEREADTYSIEMLQKAGLSPRNMATILGRLEAKYAGRRRGGLPDFLSSHPATKERQAQALAAARDDEPAEDVSPAQDVSPVPVRAPHGIIVDPVQRQIVELVEKRDYEALERLFSERQAAFERDPATSPVLDSSYRAFGKVDPAAGTALDEWVARYPASYAARASRATFFLFLGLDARGTDYYSDTSEENLRDMRMWLEQARAEADRSLTMTPKPYASRRTLMTIARVLGRRADALAHYGAAIAMAPESVDTRLDHMTLLEPRWGGSYAEMEKFAAESRAQLKAPGGADRLAARVAAYRAGDAMRARDFAAALRDYDRALALDPETGMSCERAYVLGELKRDDEALAEAKRVLAKAPDQRYCRELAPRVASRATNAGEAIAVMNLVIDADPKSTSALTQRGWRYQQQNRLDLAFPDYLAAAKLGDPWAELQAGKCLWNGWGVKADREEGLGWLRKAAAHGNPDAKVSLEQALAEAARK